MQQHIDAYSTTEIALGEKKFHVPMENSIPFFHSSSPIPFLSGTFARSYFIKL